MEAAAPGLCVHTAPHQRSAHTTPPCPSSVLQAHDEVRFLLYRLDFQEFAKRRSTLELLE